jgi:putative ABC transport system ATP-binding protein
MNKEVIKCQGLVKTYNSGQPNEFSALRGLDISIKEGEFISIIGASGSGKSTLLNMISCLDTPTEGEVYIEDTPLSKLNGNQRAHLRNQKLGFIFQQFNLLRSMTTFENVEITMRFAGMRRPRNQSKKPANRTIRRRTTKSCYRKSIGKQPKNHFGRRTDREP